MHIRGTQKRKNIVRDIPEQAKGRKKDVPSWTFGSIYKAARVIYLTGFAGGRGAAARLVAPGEGRLAPALNGGGLGSQEYMPAPSLPAQKNVLARSVTRNNPSSSSVWIGDRCFFDAKVQLKGTDVGDSNYISDFQVTLGDLKVQPVVEDDFVSAGPVRVNLNILNAENGRSGYLEMGTGYILENIEGAWDGYYVHLANNPSSPYGVDAVPTFSIYRNP